MGKTEQAWRVLDAHLDLTVKLRSGSPVIVDADLIKRLTGREPRLMTKFDTRRTRPRALRGATVLPVTNGRYAILPGDGYHDVEPGGRVSQWVPQAGAASLVTLPWNTVPTTESQVLDMALIGGLLNDFLQEERLFLTVRGRARSPRFSFRFRTNGVDHGLTVDGVQVEVDAGLEGFGLYLAEAKLGARSDFHIRQLYYPFRMWRELAPAKEIFPLYCGYADKVFSLRLYRVDPEAVYHSLQLVRAADVTFSEAHAELSLRDILEAAPLDGLPDNVPFPQADDFRRVIDLIDATASSGGETAYLAERYGFDPRQATYYRAAATFLGVLEGGRPTTLGLRVLSAGRYERHRLLVDRMARLPVFRTALEFMVDKSTIPPVLMIEEWIREQCGLSGTTPARRAQTVAAWMRWVQQELDPR